MKKIAIIRFSAIGDVALWLPVVNRALALNNNLEITFVTKKNTSFLFENKQNLKVISFDFTTEYKGIFGLLSMAKFINNCDDFDIIIDGHDVFRTKILMFLLHAKKKFTFYKGRKEKKNFVAGNHNQLPHTTQRYIDVMQQAGVQIDNQFSYPNVSIAANDIVKANDFLNKINNDLLIGIAPFAMHAGKIFPMHKMEEVIAELSKNNYSILLFGIGKNEVDVVSNWLKKYSNIFVTTALSFAQELHVMKSCTCILSMDSANMHLASLQGIKVVSIWGATHAEIGFAPLYNNSKNIVEIDNSELPCRPCSIFGNKPCGLTTEPYACLNRITTEQILKKINSDS